jgi:hypothetical protein
MSQSSALATWLKHKATDLDGPHHHFDWIYSILRQTTHSVERAYTTAIPATSSILWPSNSFKYPQLLESIITILSVAVSSQLRLWGLNHQDLMHPANSLAPILS